MTPPRLLAVLATAGLLGTTLLGATLVGAAGSQLERTPATAPVATAAAGHDGPVAAASLGPVRIPGVSAAGLISTDAGTDVSSYAAGPGFVGIPQCGGGPGLPPAGSAPALCVHADRAPPGVDVHQPVTTAELLDREGATGAAAAAAGAGPVAVAVASSSSTVPCYGDGTSGDRVQALYVVTTDRPNRFATLAPVIREWAAGVDDVINRSAGMSGGVRHVRFVTTRSADGSCQPTVRSVTLPAGSLNSFDATINAMSAAGYTSPARKYLIWSDANVLCGIATLYDDSSAGQGNYNNGFAAQYARIDNGCWGFAQSVEAHELTHTLGGVQPDSPHHTPYGHCFDESDRMCYDDGSGIGMRQVCPASHEALLDCNFDDYFAIAPHAGSYLATHWNTARSAFLATTGSLQVTETAATMVPGLPSNLTAQVTLASGRRLASVSFLPSDHTCRITQAARTATHASVTCPASTAAAPAIRVTVTDSAGESAATSLTPAFSTTARTATLSLTVDGESPTAGQWCATTGTLAARLVDDATGHAVVGIPVTFLRADSPGGPTTTLATSSTSAAGSASSATTLSASVYDATSAAVGPWPTGATNTAQALQIATCVPRLTARSAAVVRHPGQAVTFSGTLFGDAAGHLVPAIGEPLTVTLRAAGGSVTTLGTTTVRADGTWLVHSVASRAGTLQAHTDGSGVLAAASAPLGSLTVAPWPTTVHVKLTRATGPNGKHGYQMRGTVLRTGKVGVAGARVEVWTVHAGKRRLAVTRTSATGAFRVFVRARAGLRVKVHALGSAGFRPSVSAAMSL